MVTLLFHKNAIFISELILMFTLVTGSPVKTCYLKNCFVDDFEYSSGEGKEHKLKNLHLQNNYPRWLNEEKVIVHWFDV